MLSDESRREAFVQMALDQAFVVSDVQLRRYMLDTLAGGRRIRTDELPVRTASDLLAMAHAIELGAHRNLATDLRFRVTRLGDETARHEFYEHLDCFEIELVDDTPPETPA
jgi:hypothetical protein